MVDFRIEPRKAALIVHDLQRVFIKGPFAPPNSRLYVERIRKLIEVCRSKEIPVIYTKACFRRDGADMGLIGEFFEPIRRRELLIEDQEDSEIVDELVPLNEEIIIRKVNSYSAFYNTALESILRNLGVDTIVIVGGATNVGVEATSRDAHSRGIKAILLEDATYAMDLPDVGWGTISRDQVHKTVLTNIAFCIGQVMKSEDLIKKLK